MPMRKSVSLPVDPRYYAYSTIKTPDKGEVGGSSPPRPTINPQCLCGHSRFCLSPEFPAKPFVNDLSSSGIAICRPRRHRRHPDQARGFTDCLNFLLTTTAPRHSRNGKNINVHSRHIGLWKSSLQNQRSQIRGVTVIDTCVILDHSPPYQGRVACGQSSVLVFEWEWCAIDKDQELA